MKNLPKAKAGLGGNFTKSTPPSLKWRGQLAIAGGDGIVLWVL
jgi:hypothetical protein